jgi:hypothetical protein
VTPPTTTTDAWLAAALRDVARRKLPALRPLLETLARSTSALRAADWNVDATGASDEPRVPDAP